VPRSPNLDAYTEVADVIEVGRSFLNSAIIALVTTAAILVTSLMAGYAFAKYRFRGRNILFAVMIATMFLPPIVTLIPLYRMVGYLGLNASLAGVIVPHLANAFGIFLMRQFIKGVPDELIDAARIDGTSEFGIYWRIVLPQVKPALAVLGVFTFVFQWNEFLWPLVATTSEDMRTIPVGLTLFNQEHFTIWNLTAAGAVLLFLPTALIFLASQRFFVRGIAITGMK
jgi:multiple sugar transport system permease protein